MISAWSGACRITARRRNALHDLLEQLGDALAGLGAHQRRIVRLDADDLLDLLAHPLRIGRRQVDLVDHRQHGQPLLDCGVAVGHALGLHALGGVHDQQRAIAGRQAARHFVGKIDVPGGVDQVELVALAIARVVVQGHALRLDGDAALALQVHGIEHLRLHLALFEAAAQLDQAVGERRFTVIYMGDDRKITYALHQVGSSARGKFGPEGPERADYSRKSRSSSGASSRGPHTSAPSSSSTGTFRPQRRASSGSASTSTSFHRRQRHARAQRRELGQQAFAQLALVAAQRASAAAAAQDRS